MERLVSRLAELLRTSPLSAIVPDIIVVQSRGMERWVSMQIAQENGVAANCRFPFPRALIDEWSAALMPDVNLDNMYAPDTLGFVIHQLLPEMLDRDAFSPLRDYLRKDPDPLKQYQLACRIADLFDQYAVFRPDMLMDWTAGRQQHWQAILWRSLNAMSVGCHRAEMYHRLVAALRDTATPADRLPERLCVFGISYLPPVYLEIFSALSARCPVHMFLMNPCREYWGDIFSKKEIARVMERTTAYQTDPDDLHLEPGHPLLASMGHMGRMFIDQVQALDARVTDAFDAPEGHSLLNRLQRDILTLREPPGGVVPMDPKHAAPPAAAAPDRSVQIHACHSPLREVEVLHDRLLHLFDTFPDIAPRDVIVMTPDIEGYAPYIHAVFDAPRDRRMQIRYTVSDEPLLSRSQPLRMLMKLLSFRHRRLGVTDLLDLLSCPAIRNRFGLEEDDVLRIEKWVRDTRIRWGADKHARRAQGLPAVDAHTWREGVRRLLLGLAMPAMEGEGIFADILPYDAIEGADARILGCFLTLLEAVLELPEALQDARPLDEWVSFLSDLIARFFISGDEVPEDLRPVLQCVASLNQAGGRHMTDTAMSSRIIEQVMRRQVVSETVSGGFLAGGVSFCTLLPMRSIPAKVIGLMGMNHDAFPRQYRSLGFDLMARSPRPGDRDRRKDDKYLFLETLVCARRVLYISYVGQSVIDNSMKPPSGPVSELLDTITTYYGIDESSMIIRHPLQAFSTDYFTGRDGLFSYAAENCTDATQLPPAPDTPFFDGAYPPPPEKLRSVDVTDLCRFFSHPVKYLVCNRVGLDIERLPERLTDRIDFEIDGLSRFRMGQELVERYLKGKSIDDRHRVYRLAGRLPPGVQGDVMFRDLRELAATMARRVKAAMGDDLPSTLDVDLHLGAYRVTGALDILAGNGRVHYHFASATPRLLLMQWVSHLVMTAVSGTDPRLSTRLITPNADIALSPVSRASAILETLMDLYWEGLHQPLHLYPKTSYTYAFRKLNRTDAAATARAAARTAWAGSGYSASEGQDPYLALCFRHEDALDERFEAIAEAVFAPIFDHGGVL